jgi:hypothetical protein
LGASSIGGIVLCIAKGVNNSVSGLVGSCVGSGVDRLCDFVFASALFSHGLKGALL